MSSEKYKKIIVQWQEFQLPEYRPRLTTMDLESDFITTISGPRRAGKTYFCFQLIDQLRKEKKDNILYINFEDEKLLNADAEDLNKLQEAYYELTTLNPSQKIYFFLDEIQNVNNWDVWVRRIYDHNKNIRLILTGSSSKLLSREISTKLRGRVINTEIYPLSFKEFLHWKNVNYDLKTISHSQKKIELKKEFSQYLSNGGYPAVLQNPSEQILQNYYETMIFRDIVERYNVKEIKKLKVLASLIFASVAKQISYNKLANTMKSLGFNISKNTIIEYLSYFEDAYLFFQNLKYEYSLTKQLGSIKKVYCIDNGLLNSVSFKFSEDIGKLMENLVFLELKRKYPSLYYHQGKYECDFLVKEKNKVVSAFQVTEKLTDENYQREINGLSEALKAYNLETGLILTYDDETEINVEGKKILVLPLWKFLLND